ncbi:OmpL47-type beta-barrel domain-containing protein [Bacillus sp. T33-2]|uniref:OmpL47-type beta-barrel domain-containing protein n=1 Tax=Bacillus sp. T33-2 TaxID=2054168 RepID=UPI000C76D1F4|nr:hypothetical protein [Bacillus sp. T33-2]PLR99280.1 hypothetical protein CVD19_02910 [Bacillus sp. T33-2]
MKMKKVLSAGVLTCALLIPTTIFAASDTGSATDPASSPQSHSLLKSNTLQTANLQVTGNITPITTPTSEYTSNTSKIDISHLFNYNMYNSVTDGVQTISFSSPMERRQVRDSWEADWGPDTESRYPQVLFSDYKNEVTWNLSQPTKTFGFELSPNTYGTYSYMVDYYSGTTLVGSLTQSLLTSLTNGGIKVFGATSETPFDRVVIRSASGDTHGFAVAQIRYGEVNVDNEAPVTNATLSVVMNRLSVILSAADNDSGVENTEYRINGGDWMTYTNPVSLKFDEQLQYRSVDKSGNIEDAKTIGVTESGYQLENVYINNSRGTVGPINKTMTTAQDMVRFILNLSR